MMATKAKRSTAKGKKSSTATKAAKRPAAKATAKRSMARDAAKRPVAKRAAKPSAAKKATKPSRTTGTKRPAAKRTARPVEKKTKVAARTRAVPKSLPKAVRATRSAGFYKDNPDLVSARVEPDKRYDLSEAHDDVLRAMART